MNENKIDSFSKEYRFLSNFYPTRIIYDKLIYPSVENAFQAAKTLEFDIRMIVKNLSAGEAKKLGRKIKLRPDWEQIKIPLMTKLVFRKFYYNIELAEKLVNTFPKELIEGNYWHDTFWGVCNGVGENHLGKILMQVRNDIIERKMMYVD